MKILQFFLVNAYKIICPISDVWMKSAGKADVLGGLRHGICVQGRHDNLKAPAGVRNVKTCSVNKNGNLPEF
ncbi:MAG: hypothetical protein NTZ02_00990 [Candidatus Woesearchaeota archaeon]|nr:hypothetical protein [Candidatus Woesearchaeota archaeon]